LIADTLVKQAYFGRRKKRIPPISSDGTTSLIPTSRQLAVRQWFDLEKASPSAPKAANQGEVESRIYDAERGFLLDTYRSN